MLRAEEIDWRRLFIAYCIDRGEFDCTVSKRAWEKADGRGADVHRHENGTWAAWINEDFPLISGVEGLGKGMGDG